MFRLWFLGNEPAIKVGPKGKPFVFWGNYPPIQIAQRLGEPPCHLSACLAHDRLALAVWEGVAGFPAPVMV